MRSNAITIAALMIATLKQAKVSRWKPVLNFSADPRGAYGAMN